MSSINGGGYSQVNPAHLKAVTYRAQFAKLPDMSTGLNTKGNSEFRTRMQEVLKENGISGTISFSRNEQDKFVVDGNHPDKEKIENLLNNDEKLTNIRNDPANAFDFTEGRTKSTGQDSAYFSEQARMMYEQRANNGQGTYASSVEDTAKVMEWMNKPNGVRAALANDPFMKIEQYQSPLTAGYSGDAEKVDISKLGQVKSDVIEDLASTRNWLETEISSVLEKAGIDTSKLSGVKFGMSGGKVGVLVNQAGISEKDRQTIESIINSSDNQQLAKVMERYLGEANLLSSQLQKATGLNDADWAEVMASGGDLTNVDNDGMKALLANDPELASALSSFFNGGSGFLANAQMGSSRESAQNAVRGLGIAINSVVTGGASSIGLSAQEIEDLKKNLSVEVHSDGSYKVGGTQNSKLLSVIDSYVSHYLSGSFAEMLKSGSLLNQALGGAKSGDGVMFTFNFQDGKPNASMQYGDNEKQSVKF